MGRPRKIPPKFGEVVVANGEKSIWRAIQLHDGKIVCGRCLEPNDPSKQNRSLCFNCYRRVIILQSYGRDLNRWNVRDTFCYTKINHHEKVFEIGVRVDERTQEYLTAIGYGFIFKEPYEERPVRPYKPREKKKDVDPTSPHGFEKEE